MIFASLQNSRKLIWCFFDSNNLLRFTKLVKCKPEFQPYHAVFLKIRNIISKNRRSIVTDYATLMNQLMSESPGLNFECFPWII